MDERQRSKLQEVVFERLVCGEDHETLRHQLLSQTDQAEADRFVSEALLRMDQGSGSAPFAKSVQRIRKRRLVGARYLAWKILAWIFIVPALLYALLTIFTGGQFAGSFGGILVGGIILAFVERQERTLITFDTATSP